MKNSALLAVRGLARLRPVVCAFLAIVIIAAVASGWHARSAKAAGVTSGPRIWLGETQPLPVTHAPASGTAVQRAMDPETFTSPTTLASGDVDGDGIADLVTGYRTGFSGMLSIHKGNVDAFAPQSEASFQAIGRGEFPAPFMTAARSLSSPVSPDFIAIGDFTGDSNPDLLVAARGGSALYIFAGDGKGNFAAPQPINLPASIDAVIAGGFGAEQQYPSVLVGLSTGRSSFLAVFTASAQGLVPTDTFALPGKAISLVFGDLDGDNQPDAAIAAGGQVLMLHGGSRQLQNLGLPVSAQSLAIGSFLPDRHGFREQLAIAATDETIYIAAHEGFDPRGFTDEERASIRAAGRRGYANPVMESLTGGGPADEPWKVVESFAGAAPLGAGGAAPVMFRTRISDHGADDIMVLSAATGQMSVILHPDPAPGATSFVPGEVSTRPYAATPVAAIPVRTNIDGRPGVLALHAGQDGPSVMMPLPDPTFTVNTTVDGVNPGACAAATPGQCTLREAVLEANSTAGTDTIMVPAGTYTLTLPKVANDFSGNHGALYVNDSVNIIGAGQNTTIIQAGTSNATGVDMVMAVNEDINPITNATASISNLTLKFGHNNGAHGNDGDGGCMEFDTGSSGNANLTLTNVTLDSCSTTKGEGGGIAIFNFTTPNNGLVAFANSIIQNNSASDTSSPTIAATAGGIWVSQNARMSMTGTQVLNNNATQVSGDLSVAGEGGGITIANNTPNSRQTVIHSSTISGNHSTGNGGGIHSESNLLIDQGTVISNNVAGTANLVNARDGGGLWISTSSNGCPAACTDVTTLSHVTITGNSATLNGGGIAIGNNTGAGSVTMTFSRLVGNSAPSGSNLRNNSTSVSATDNWWGSNAASATINTINTGTTTFDPFIVLTHSATPAKIRINQSATLTGDMSKDNHGTAITVANLDRIVGLPITFNNPVLGSIPQAQPETLNSSAQATATFNAGGTSGRGSADATVDSATVSANSNLIASATEAGTTATITTVGVHNFAANETVVIAGVGVSGYNGTFTIVSTPTPTTFTYTAATAGLGASSGGTAKVGIIILEPPQITKSFGAATIAVNATTTVTFNLNNPNVVAINGSFTDTLPAGLQVAATPGVTNTCGGTVTAAAGSGSISFSNNLLPAGACSINVNITGTVDNNYTNSVQVLSTDAGNGNTTSASLTVINPPSIAKQFGAATIPLNGATSLTFTLSSTNQNLTLNGVAFTDNLPAGLVVASTPNLSNTCGGTATAVAGSFSASLSGVSLAPGASCTVSLNLQGTTTGVKNNSVQVTSTNGGTGNTSNASITVVGPPTISKAFGAASIPLNGTTSVTFTIANPNTTVDLSGVAFSDTLPNSTGTLVVATPNGVANTCGGTVTATAGTGVISLSGANVARNTSCTLSLNVTGTAAGDALNTTGAVTSTEGGTGATSNTATLKVVAPPTISKAFGAAAIPVAGTTTLTFTITNPAANTTSETGIAFSDTLTGGLQVASTPGVSNTCGGTVTAAANSTSISLTGGSIATPGNSCTIVVNVTGTQSGNVTNTTGAVSSTNGGTGATSNTATLVVASPPSISKTFGAAQIPLNGTASLTFNISNPNTGITLNGLAFTDNLPAGLVVASTPGLSNTCGGTATAVGGSGAVSLSAGTLAASASCTVSLNVQGTTAGVKNNSVQVTSTEGGTGNTSNASLTVVGPPVIIKAFGAASIPLNGSTSLSFTIQNNNTGTTQTGVAFADTLPAGLVVSTPNGQTGSCGGGTITATQGTNTISLSGATIAASSSCTFAVNVTGVAAGLQSNTTGQVSSTEGGTGGTASASVKVEAPPSIAKAFAPSTILENATTSLTFTITNPAANVDPLTGVAFTDTLPTGLTVANASATICGGTVTTTAPTGIALSGGTIAANGQCQFSVTVKGAVSGQYTNTTGNVTSTNGGTGNTASANLTVSASAPVISKAFGAASIPLNGSTSLSFTIQNNNTGTTQTGVAFTDTLPAGLVVSTPNGQTGSCGGGTIAAVAGTHAVSLTGGSIAPSSSCTFAVNVTGVAAGLQNNTTGQVSSTEGGTGGTASASVKVEAPPSIAKVFNPANIALNGTSSLTFTITNPAGNVDPENGVAFTDTLPTGLTVANASATICGGTVTTTAPTGIALSGGTIAANGQCQFSVTVTGAAAGQYTNTTGNVTSANGGTGNTATANLSVATAPTITKAFGAASILVNANSSLTFNISNPNTTIGLTGVSFTDALPAGLNVAAASGLTSTCGGATTAAGGSISLTGGTLAANGSCTIGVNVTGIAAGVQNNTTGAISSTESGPGAASNTATITVIGAPTLAKGFGAASIPLNGTTSLTFTATNPNPTVAMTGVAFADTFPAGLVVATPNGLTGSCGSGTITSSTVAGLSVVSLSGGTIAAGGSCTFSLNVVGTTLGSKVNTTGAISTTNAGTGGTATASVNVIASDLTLTKTHTGAFTAGQSGAAYTLTVNNVGNVATAGTVTVADNLPTGLTATAISGTGWSCTLGTLTCTRADALAAGASYPAITLTVNVSSTALGTITNTATVSGGAEVNTGNDTASDSASLGPPLTLTAVNGSGTVTAGGSASFTFNVAEAVNPPVGTVSFACSGLPAKTACNFNPPTINASGQITMTISSASNLASAAPAGRRNLGMLAVLLFPAFGLVHLAGSRRRRKSLVIFLGVFLMALLVAAMGCGGQPLFGNGTPPGTYNVTVTATGSGASATSTVTLNVK